MAWYYNSAGAQILTGTTDNDVFQLGTNMSVGGVQAGFDTYFGGDGYDQIWVAPKSGYSWTAVMLDNFGINGIEAIVNYTTGPAPVYFQGYVNFIDVITLTSNIKMHGRGGNDQFDGGSLGEWVSGDAGDDILAGNGGDDTLYGDSTFDNPWAVDWAAAGNDTLYGGAGNDTINGQGGNDHIWGGDGTNLLTGEAGDDIFYFDSATASDFITDFGVGNDTIAIKTTIADDFSDLTITTGASGAEITVGGLFISLTGYNAASLTAADFTFFA